ncbi:hypothetical protein J3F83DRAFT_519034 [Trichoderma novae-zelandiae]
MRSWSFIVELWQQASSQIALILSYLRLTIQFRPVYSIHTHCARAQAEFCAGRILRYPEYARECILLGCSQPCTWHWPAFVRMKARISPCFFASSCLFFAFFCTSIFIGRPPSSVPCTPLRALVFTMLRKVLNGTGGIVCIVPKYKIGRLNMGGASSSYKYRVINNPGSPYMLCLLEMELHNKTMKIQR